MKFQFEAAEDRSFLGFGGDDVLPGEAALQQAMRELQSGTFIRHG